MAVLHKEFISFNKAIKLTQSKKESLLKSRKEIRKKIRKWFKDNKPNELQPKFATQGSKPMNTITNPIVEIDENNKSIYKYDLDDGVYFIEKAGEDNKRGIFTWHDWVYEAVDGHTGQPTIRKTTCVRVVFADGHHIDLPIYYKESNNIELAHKSKGWLQSDPKEFYEWFNNKKTKQLERIVRYLKAWKNFREVNNTSLKLPSGFELTILATNNYIERDNDDESLRVTIAAILRKLSSPNGFKCIRPTTPVGEDVFSDYSESKKENFLNALKSLQRDLDRADQEENFRKASKILRNNQFGERFPLGEDKSDKKQSKNLASSLAASVISPKPYASND